jgi:hypothetical protein
LLWQIENSVGKNQSKPEFVSSFDLKKMRLLSNHFQGKKIEERIDMYCQKLGCTYSHICRYPIRSFTELIKGI